ncbi:6909_t:CDS:1, partial [Scutellospora calospora]
SNSDWSNCNWHAKDQTTPIVIVKEFVRKDWAWNFYTIYNGWYHRKIIFLFTKHDIDNWYNIFRTKEGYDEKTFNDKLWRLDESYVYKLNENNRRKIIESIYYKYKNNLVLQNCKNEDRHNHCIR